MKKSQNSEEHLTGVQQLIERLKEEGVASGEEQAKKIVQEAESRADWIIKQAEKEASQHQERAKEAAEFTVKSARESIKKSASDVLLEIKEALYHELATQLQSSIKRELQQSDVIANLVNEIVRSAPEGATEVVVQDADAASDPAVADALIAGLKERLKEGIEVSQQKSGGRTGVQIRLDGGKVIVDIDDATLTQSLLRRLQPQFRQIVEGVSI